MSDEKHTYKIKYPFFEKLGYFYFGFLSLKEFRSGEVLIDSNNVISVKKNFSRNGYSIEFIKDQELRTLPFKMQHAPDLIKKWEPIKSMSIKDSLIFPCKLLASVVPLFAAIGLVYFISMQFSFDFTSFLISKTCDFPCAKIINIFYMQHIVFAIGLLSIVIAYFIRKKLIPKNSTFFVVRPELQYLILVSIIFTGQLYIINRNQFRNEVITSWKNNELNEARIDQIKIKYKTMRKISSEKPTDGEL